MTDKLQFSPSRFLTDKPYGVKVNGLIFVSPAVWALMTDATDREMRLLTHALKVIDLDSPAARELWKQKYGKDLDPVLHAQALVDT